ncbi:hypothetical protein F0562_019379 [Nyssa sinensis]|uniref:Aluminum-activated malate transporter n=1 Tax=Nyssa sinensis TaxID=561372 RepID=A0A5J4ZCN8_9ASTE|nr:hypothetical protein F0562_019379 [Nyssa sinensis]
MVAGKDMSGQLEWSVNVPNGRSEILVPESGAVNRVCLGIKGLVVGFVLKIWRFLEKAWNLGVSEPKKVIHCVKVGMALSIVSLFYYMRPLYEGVGGNAMWAVMTVVVVFEYTVGATLCKCINRATGTFLAGSLGIGVHWVASQSDEKIQPVILGISVFLLASAATFSRFIPSVKARFDYGAMIFILTFSLVSVSGYRVDKLFDYAHQRLSTIAIGTSICIIISMLLCPIWAGDELHRLTIRNLKKLADSLDGCVTEYFKEDETESINEKDTNNNNLQGYKCVLNSKATEESMANFARWEPAHGHFNFRHPWKQYLKIGAAMRNCACCIETLNGRINSEIQAPEFLKRHLSDVCKRLSSHSSIVLEEMATTMKTMRKSSKIDLLVGEMNFAVEDLQNALESLPKQLMISSPLLAIEASNDAKEELIMKPILIPLMDILPLATVVTLLIEITVRIEGIVDAVEELADQAEFKPQSDQKKSKQNQPATDDHDDETVKTLQKV